MHAVLSLSWLCFHRESGNFCCVLQNSDVAFTIVVNRQADDDDTGQGEDDDDDPDNNNRVEVDFVQEAVQEAIQEAVQDAVQEVWSLLKFCQQWNPGSSLMPCLDTTVHRCFTCTCEVTCEVVPIHFQ